MSQQGNTLVLEVFKQYEALKLSIFEQKDSASTLKHYYQQSVSFREVKSLCQELTGILKKTQNYPQEDPELENSFKKTANLLWEHLLARQVKEKLKLARGSELILSLDDELVDIPWELFFDGSEFLCLKFSVGRLVRTKEHFVLPPQYRDLSSTIKMLILANPTSDLKSAYKEGLNIRNQFDKKRAYLKIDFKSENIDTLYVKKNIRDYDLVHFAGHCEYDEDQPQKSGWVLSDGRLSIESIMALGHTVSLPGLVFSNACHSAQADNESIGLDYQTKAYNLASAFLLSGVKHYIGAIRKIEDRSALIFAREFYSYLLKGETVGSSLRKARFKLSNEHRIVDFSWANYILYGDPAFRFFKTREKNRAVFSLGGLFVRHKRVLVLSGYTVAIASALLVIFFWIRNINPSDRFQFQKARGLFLRGDNQAVLNLSEKIIKHDSSFLAVYPLLADTYQRLGNYEQSLKYYFEYALESQKRGDLKNVASAYNGIGWVYYNYGDYQKSAEFYEKALETSRQTHDKLNEASTLRRMATWHIDKEQYDKALELLAKSSEINRSHPRSGEHQYNLACDYFSMAYIFFDKGDYAAAKEFYEKSGRIFKKLKLNYELNDYYFNLGEIAAYEKDYKKAFDLYSKGLEIDLTQGNLPALAADYNMMGELYQEMGDSAKAEELFEKAVTLSKQINSPQELAWAYQNLGLLYKQKNQKSKAREFFRLAQEIYRRIDTPAYQTIREELVSLDQ